MSQNIKIKEGGTAMTFGGLDRLIVPLSGSGESQWIPKSTVTAPDKSIDKNGTYKAVSEGVYGWKQVSVSVQQSDHVTGKGPDGKKYTVSVDENGNLVETKLPTRIEITAPPTFTGPYFVGQMIDYTGIVVTAYDENNEPWTNNGEFPDGVIPDSLLTFPVSVVPEGSEYEIRYDDHRFYYVEDMSATIANVGEGMPGSAYLGPQQVYAIYVDKGDILNAFYVSTGTIETFGYRLWPGYGHNGVYGSYAFSQINAYPKDEISEYTPQASIPYATAVEIAESIESLDHQLEMVPGTPIPVQFDYMGAGLETEFLIYVISRSDG